MLACFAASIPSTGIMNDLLCIFLNISRRSRSCSACAASLFTFKKGKWSGSGLFSGSSSFGLSSFSSIYLRMDWVYFKVGLLFSPSFFFWIYFLGLTLGSSIDDSSGKPRCGRFLVVVAATPYELSYPIPYVIYKSGKYCCERFLMKPWSFELTFVALVTTPTDGEWASLPGFP